MTEEEEKAKQKAYQKTYREANKEKAKEYQKKYKADNAEKLHKAGREYHLKNRDQRNAYRRQWSIENKTLEQAGRKRWYAENKDGRYLDTRLQSKYGITLTQYQFLLDLQGGTCALCSRTDAGTKDKRRLHVDHSHKTGIVRGLLCHFHNTAVGALGDDDPDAFGERIKTYLAGNPLSTT